VSKIRVLDHFPILGKIHKNLTIRVRLCIWFTLAVTLLLCIFAVIFYFALKPAMENQVAQRLLAEASQIAGEVESRSDGSVYMDDSFKNFESPYFSVYDLRGRVMERNHMLTWLDQLPSDFGATRVVNQDGSDWMVCDFPATEDGITVALVRTSEKLSAISEATGQALILVMLLLPLSCLLAIPTGLWIAQKALAPIDEITKTAAAITKGDLSMRVTGGHASDEVGHLADTFNDMLQTLEDAMERERQFTSDASHELRTPLAVILANAETGLEDDSSIISKNEALHNILIKGREATAMLSQLLLLARNGRLTALEIVPVHLDDMVEDIADTLAARAMEKGITFQLPEAAVGAAWDNASETNGDKPIVLADLQLLTRAVLNLAENAIKYGKENGHVTFNLRKEGMFWDLIVADDGPGIAPEHLTRIFDRFYQADPAHHTQGTGLGLAIVKQIATLHGGEVRVYSTVGKGSQFHLLIPS
jgi:signal transduction histidine kinase